MRKLKDYKPTRFMAETSHYSKQMADFAVMFIERHMGRKTLRAH